MAEQQKQSAETAKENLDGIKNCPSGADMSASEPQSKFKKILAKFNAFLDSLDEEEPEPPPPPEKPLKESIQEFIERCRDREKRIVLLREFGEWGWTMFFRGTVFFFLFVLTIWGTIWALDFSENHRIKFYPPDEVVDYLTAEHENIEKAAFPMTPEKTTVFRSTASMQSSSRPSSRSKSTATNTVSTL